MLVRLPTLTPAPSSCLPSPSHQGGSNTASLGGAFIDIYNFTLDQALTLTIAFATNTYAGGNPQFITNFTGAVVYEGADGQIGGGDDQVVLGPELATACNMIPQCQVFGGFANLDRWRVPPADHRQCRCRCWLRRQYLDVRCSRSGSWRGIAGVSPLSSWLGLAGIAVAR